jgi:Lysyl oxidase/WD40-like Beta Propeller Repeat
VIAPLLAAAALAAEPVQPRLLVERGGALVRVDPGGAGIRPLLANGADAAWSPDGTLIVFVRDGDLWTANADGSGRRPIARTPNVVESEPAWSPDGRTIAYTATIDGAPQVRAIAPTGGGSAKLADDASSPAFSPDGKHLAYARTDGVYVDGTLLATPDALPNPRGLDWSSDGKYVAYASDGGIVVAPVDGSQALVISADGDDPVWSPDASRIAFTRAGDVQIANADGSDDRDLGPGTALDWRRVPLGTPLWPDLRQRPPSGLTVMSTGRRFLLGFTSLVDNIGPGTLWIRGVRPPHSPTMNVAQLVYLRDGGLRVVRAAGHLHYTVAPPHYHWHLLGFEHYELRRAGDFKLVVRDRKSGFCIADHYGIAPGVRHGPPRFLGSCAQFDPRATSVEEGASVGYTDRYPAFFHGQQLDVTHVAPGRYWLVHRANQGLGLREERYDNDVASLLVRITWPGGRHAPPRVTPLRACMKERC